MNDRLAGLIDQLRDTMSEIREIVPVLRIYVDPFEIEILVQDEKAITEGFSGYIRVPLTDSVYNFNSEVYTTINGATFHTYSELPVPPGFSKVVVANPEREAV